MPSFFKKSIFTIILNKVFLTIYGPNRKEICEETYSRRYHTQEGQEKIMMRINNTQPIFKKVSKTS
jgi:hypothetical protein